MIQQKIESKLSKLDLKIEKLQFTLRELEPIYNRLNISRNALMNEVKFLQAEKDNLTQGQLNFDDENFDF